MFFARVSAAHLSAVSKGLEFDVSSLLTSAEGRSEERDADPPVVGAPIARCDTVDAEAFRARRRSRESRTLSKEHLFNGYLLPSDDLAW